MFDNKVVSVSYSDLLKIFIMIHDQALWTELSDEGIKAVLDDFLKEHNVG